MAVDQGEELLAAEHYEKGYFCPLYSFENQGLFLGAEVGRLSLHLNHKPALLFVA